MEITAIRIEPVSNLVKTELLAGDEVVYYEIVNNIDTAVKMLPKIYKDKVWNKHKEMNNVG